MNLDDLRKRRMELNERSGKTISNMPIIANESMRAADVAHHSRELLDNLDAEFERRTKLDGNDFTFLLIAVGLQITRQWLSEIFLDRQRPTDKELSNKAKSGTTAKMIAELNYGEWILGPACYDAFHKTPNLKRRKETPPISGMNHRYTTIAHDPIMGLVFGPINLMSNSLTISGISLETHKTRAINPSNPATGYLIDIPFPGGVAAAFTEALNNGASDYKFAGAAVIKHLIHVASDIGTIQGLPIPGAGTLLSNDVNAWLLKNNIDFIWLANIGSQMVLASMINTIVAIAYRWLLFDDAKYPNPNLFTVKTKKIIAYSNEISSSVNLLRVGLDIARQDYGSALRHLDIGGLLVTIHAMIDNANFQQKIKEEFVFGEFNKMIQSEEYDF